MAEKEEIVASKVLTPAQAEAEQKWNQLSTVISLDAKNHGYFEIKEKSFSKTNGSLVMIGSGIKCVGQFTLEAISHIRKADKVLYCVADPATEVYIRDLRPDALDLYVFYADGKNRYETYVQMSEACLYLSRQGLHVVGIFYGHPGVFVLPSHRAIQIALKQGIKAYMLPAVSAEDCLFADLGIDPSFPGLQTLEATDMLLRQRKLLTDAHVVIWQVGCVGDLGYRRQGYLNRNFHVLIEYLQATYGKEYVITHYIGAQFPMCAPTIERHRLSDFMRGDVAKRVTGISTFYIPPKEAKEVKPEMAVRLGLVQKEQDAKRLPKIAVRPVSDYGLREIKSIADLDQWVVPSPYAHTSPTKVAQYIATLATDVQMLRSHMQEPEKMMKAFDLGPLEFAALQSKDFGQIRMALKPNPLSVAKQVVICLATDPQFIALFTNKCNEYKAEPNGKKMMHDWLLQEGCDTTLQAVLEAKAELQMSSLIMWSGRYISTVPNATIVIQGAIPPSIGKVWAAGIPIKKFAFSNSTLSWSSKDGNHCSASLTFVQQEKDVFAFTGKCWKGVREPQSCNFSGHKVSLKTCPCKSEFKDLVNATAMGLHSLGMVLSVQAFWEACKNYKESPTQKNKKKMEDALLVANEDLEIANNTLEPATRNVQSVKIDLAGPRNAVDLPKYPTTVTADPTTVTADPTTVTADPTTVTADPTTVTADPTTVTADPTTVTTDPTTVTADPTTVTADPTTVTADPTTVTADPTTVTADPTTVTADPTTVTADPTTVTADPTTVTADPATVTADPTTVTADPTTVTADPTTVTADPTTMTADPTTVTADPTTVTADPTTVTADPTTVTADPTTVTADPTTVTADPTTVTADPTTVTADPTTVTADPTTVTADPTTVTADPATVTADPTTVTADPTTVTADPATVTADPTTVTADPTTVTADPMKVPADSAVMAGTCIVTVDFFVPI